MTEVYGAGRGAKIKQIEEFVNSKLNNKLNWGEEKIKEVSIDFQSKIDKAIKEELPSSNIFKKWMKKITREVSSKNRAIEWYTPIIKFRVIQEEFETKKERIHTKYNGKKNSIQIRIETDKIDKGEQSKGISPNFIHSLDATHLFLTVLKSKEIGIDSFATIHDSFGTHACDIDNLIKAIKSSFIDMYQEDILESFRKYIVNKHNIEIKPINYQGDLESFEIEKVNSSLYFFS